MRTGNGGVLGRAQLRPDFCSHQTGLPQQDTAVHRVPCRMEASPKHSVWHKLLLRLSELWLHWLELIPACLLMWVQNGKLVAFLSSLLLGCYFSHHLFPLPFAQASSVAHGSGNGHTNFRLPGFHAAQTL